MGDCAKTMGTAAIGDCQPARRPACPCMRDEYITDTQGRRVRAKHAAAITEGGEQFMLWADIRTAPHKHMAIAFQQRRHQIVGDCRQLKVDVDSYNQNRTPDQPIQMIFDFTYDLEELALAT